MAHARRSTARAEFDAAELVERFDEGWHTFYHTPASFEAFYQGPCLHFHVRTLSVLRRILSQPATDYRDVMISEEYVELLYATLTAWGMNSTRGGPKLQDYRQFRNSFAEHAPIETLNALREARLSDEDDIENLKVKVKILFDFWSSGNRIMKSGKSLVSTAKTLHHLLPHLLMPVDGEHVIKLLNRLREVRFRPTLQGDSFQDYWKCICFSHFVARRKGLTHAIANDECPMDTSVPKRIDNSIVGLKFMLLPKSESEESS